MAVGQQIARINSEEPHEVVAASPVAVTLEGVSGQVMDRGLAAGKKVIEIAGKLSLSDQGQSGDGRHLVVSHRVDDNLFSR